MNDFDYENDVKIDPFGLDEEWFKHSSLYMKYSAESALREEIKDKAKKQMDFVNAELDRDIRSGYVQEGKKVTESVIRSDIILSKKMQTAQDDYIDRCYEHNIIKGAVEALGFQKKAALEHLIKLQLSGYFSEPRVKDLSNLKENFRENLSEQVRKGIKKREVK